MARVDVTYLHGDQLEVAIRGHRIRLDQPSDAGGEDTGPSPTEVFVASLAACAAFFAENYLRHHDLPVAGLRVAAEYTVTHDRPERVASIRLELRLPSGLAADRVQAVVRATEHCTVHNSLREPPVVTVEIEAPVIAA